MALVLESRSCDGQGPQIVNNMAADGPSVSASAAVVLTYREISNISYSKPQSLNVSRLVLQLSLHNPLKPGVK